MPEQTLVGWVYGDLGAARYLSMDRKTWVKLRRRHKIQPAIIGRSRRFECAALDRLIRSLQAQGRHLRSAPAECLPDEPRPSAGSRYCNSSQLSSLSLQPNNLK